MSSFAFRPRLVGLCLCVFAASGAAAQEGSWTGPRRYSVPVGTPFALAVAKDGCSTNRVLTAPSGIAAAFIRYCDGEYHRGVIDAKTGEVIFLHGWTSNETHERMFWSEDSELVAFTSTTYVPKHGGYDLPAESFIYRRADLSLYWAVPLEVRGFAGHHVRVTQFFERQPLCLPTTWSRLKNPSASCEAPPPRPPVKRRAGPGFRIEAVVSIDEGEPRVLAMTELFAYDDQWGEKYVGKAPLPQSCLGRKDHDEGPLREGCNPFDGKTF